MKTKLWNVTGRFADKSIWTWYEAETREEAIQNWNDDREEFGVPADAQVSFQVSIADESKPLWLASGLRT